MDVKDFLKEPFVDSERVKAIRLALTKAYSESDREAVKNAVIEAQKYVDEGGDYDFEIDDALEDYKGCDPDLLADMYMLRLMRDRYCDYDDDQDYIRTGWCKQADANYYNFCSLKKRHPNAVLLFRDGDEAYCAYEEDADVLNEVCNCPLLNWNGVKAAGFPHNALDMMLPKLIRAGHRVAICDQLKAQKPQPQKRITETVKRKEPVQLELFTF